MKRKEMKKNARAVIKKHYILFVLTCLLLALSGVEFTDSLSFARSETTEVESAADPSDLEKRITALVESGHADDNIVTSVGYNDGLVDVFAKNAKKTGQHETFKDRVLGRSRGIFAGMVNYFSSGKLYVKVFDAFFTLVASPGIAMALVLLVSIIFSAFVSFFITGMLKFVARRVFMEARIYDKVPYGRFLFFFYVKRWVRTAWNLIIMKFYLFLWNFTVIGGIIKHYSYAMVPYILCENPNIKGREAITLSRKMMKGHKFELFLLDVSFIGWDFLATLTLGLTGILYSAPYEAATNVEFYVKMRTLAKENNIPNADLLNDDYLFEKADSDTLTEVYSDSIALFEKPRIESDYMKGWKKVIAKYTSIVLFIDKDVRAVEKVRNSKIRLRHERDCYKGAAYPDRLFPIPVEERRKWVNHLNYIRYYSVWNLIMMFIGFCFIGWCWEVSLHIIEDGTFVNRGMLHGPWIPIYGTGGCMILIVLNYLRKNPLAEFISAIVLCGFLEYMTSLVVELEKGKRWWDYTGYFLNLNGRICGEGLLVFGVMGMIIVYAVGPIFDHYLRKVPIRVIVPLSIVLMTCFTIDTAYSHFHPNEGKGITDYDEVIQEAAQ